MKSALLNFAIGIGLVIGIALAMFGIHWQYFLQTPMNLPPEGMIYVLKPGTSMQSFTYDLQRKGIISNPKYLIYMAKIKGSAKNIQAGEYSLISPMSPSELLSLVTNGSVRQYPIRIGEGWTFKELRFALTKAENLVIKTTNMSDDEIMAYIGLPGRHPEGYFFPDTYYYHAGSSDLDLLMRANKKLLHILYDEWAKRDINLPLARPYDALIMASLIEKETGKDAERRKISGVFTRRLNKNMRLQTDPTVIYGLGAAFDGDIRKKDLMTDTPYNTYVHKGLPITPIAMPGLASIQAALHPDDSEALYFVAAGDGGHVFSSTLEEHNRAVKKMLARNKKTI